MSAVTVKLMRLRQAPRKVRLVVDLIRGTRVRDAEAQLMALPKRAALPVAKLLKSAETAAKEQGLDTNALWISTAFCDQGSALKRRQINSRGRASMVKKFYSHITLTVTDVTPKGRAGVVKVKRQKSEVKESVTPTPTATEAPVEAPASAEPQA